MKMVRSQARGMLKHILERVPKRLKMGAFY